MTVIEELRTRREYLISAEVMPLLRLSRNALCAAVRAGRLEAIRVGNAYLFDADTLANYLEARQTTRITTPQKPTT
jgi:excisionase family DNA binding protein